MQTPHNQKGLALIMLVFILAFVAIGYAINTLDSSGIQNARDKKTAVALAEAKTALIGWSVSGLPGQLPCPEDTAFIGTEDEGTASEDCTSVLPAVGRLPWRTLGLPDLRDGNGEQLWYVISPGFRDTPINSTNIGQLNVNGVSNRAVALIISSGTILAGQNRPVPAAGSPPLVLNYLDLTNNNGDNDFSSLGPVDTFNDMLIVVTKTELFQVVERRILREVRGDDTQGLVAFYKKNLEYPLADVDDDGVADADEYIGRLSYEGVDIDDANDLFFTSEIKDILVSNDWVSLINYKTESTRKTVTITLNGQSLAVVPEL